MCEPNCTIVESHSQNCRHHCRHSPGEAVDIVEVVDDGFEDFSVNTEQERLTCDIERATEQWLLQLNQNERLHGQERVYEGATHTTAVEGAHAVATSLQLH